MLKKLCFGLIILGMSTQTMAAQTMSMYTMTPRQAIYYWASRGDVTKIRKLQQAGYQIDQLDNKNNTALCEAVLRQDQTAVNTLLSAGANSKANCMQKIPEHYKINMDVSSSIEGGLSAATLTGIGLGTAALIGGGVALAAGGGGGGGSGSSSSSSSSGTSGSNENNGNNDTSNDETRCIHGTRQDDGTCKCSNAYSGKSCESCAPGYGSYGVPNTCYKTLTCGPHQVQLGGRCACQGGYLIEYEGSCYKSMACGPHQVQKGDQCVCEVGYSLDSDGSCYKTLTCGSNQVQQGNQCVCKEGYSLDSDGSCYKTLTCGSNQVQQGNQCVCGADGYTLINGICTHVGFQNNKNNKMTKIDNIGNNDVIGLYNNSSYVAYNAYSHYGTEAGAIEIINTGNGNVVGIYSSNVAYNAYAYPSHYGAGQSQTGVINITNHGNGNIHGMYGYGTMYNSIEQKNSGYDGLGGETGVIWYGNATGIINIKNYGDGNIYGLYSIDSDAYNAHTSSGSGVTTAKGTASGSIDITNLGNGNIYGIYSNYSAYNAYGNVHSPAVATVKIKNNGEGTSYGIYSGVTGYNGYNKDDTSVIEITNDSNGLAVGMYSNSGEIKNSGDITIHNLSDGTVVGMMTDNGTVTNSGTITINRSPYTDDMGTPDNNTDDVVYTASSVIGGTAIGIYGGTDSHITNTSTGQIIIHGAETAYGIYSEGGNVVNDGQIIIDGVTNGTNAIKLNGGQFFQRGTLQANSLNLDNIDGAVFADETTKFRISDSLSGELNLDSQITKNTFDTTYTVTDMIQASNTEGLQLKSQSALFDVQLADNGSDVVMNMKNFADVISNKSLAQFLSDNYTSTNNIDFYNTLKSFDNVNNLNKSLNQLIGKDVLTRFNFEDMTMMRELNFDMNEQLFHNKEQRFSLAGSVAPMAFKGDIGSNSRYTLSNKRNGSWSFGYGVAFMDIRSDDNHSDNKRNDMMYQMIMPIGYRTHGFNLVASPRLGYARGHYDRQGFNGTSYEGTLEKRLFGLMNEVRYPVKLGAWEFEPSIEFNMLGYSQKGHEEDKDFSLNIKRQNTYSVESGIGFYLINDKELSKESHLKLMAGISAYHEFLDPYKLELGMNGMDGSFTLRDENRSDNRAVARFGFDYEKNNISFYSNFTSYIDKEIRSGAKTGFKFKF